MKLVPPLRPRNVHRKTEKQREAKFFVEPAVNRKGVGGSGTKKTIEVERALVGKELELVVGTLVVRIKSHLHSLAYATIPEFS